MVSTSLGMLDELALEDVLDDALDASGIVGGCVLRSSVSLPSISSELDMEALVDEAVRSGGVIRYFWGRLIASVSQP